jgi:hypothetical protein
MFYNHIIYLIFLISLYHQLGFVFVVLLLAGFFILSGSTIMMKDAPAFFQPIFELSYMKHAFDSLVMSIMGYDRPPLECSSEYCLYKSYKNFLHSVEIDRSYRSAVEFLFVFIVITRTIVWSMLEIRLF